MEESVLEAYKEELVIKERYYNENVKKYEKNKTKYKVLITVNVGLIILNSYALHKLNIISQKLGDNIAGILFDYTIYDAFSKVMLILVIVLIVLVFLMYRYTHVRGEIKIGPVTIKKRNNYLSMLKEEQMRISTLKNKIDYIESFKESVFNERI